MNKYAKYTMVFAGGLVSGFALCGKIVAVAILKSDDLREIAKRRITDKIYKWLSGEECIPYQENTEPDCIIFETRSCAEHILDEMKDFIVRYGFVTVADMYDMAELSAPYTASKYGWTNLSDAIVNRTREGYRLSLPKPVKVR